MEKVMESHGISKAQKRTNPVQIIIISNTRKSASSHLPHVTPRGGCMNCFRGNNRKTSFGFFTNFIIIKITFPNPLNSQ